MPEKSLQLFEQIDVMIDEVVPAKYQRRPNPLYDAEANANSKLRPYRNLRNLPVEKVTGSAAIQEKPASAAKKASAKLMPAGKKIENRVWAKGKKQEMEGSLTDIFVNPKNKTLLKIKLADGEIKMLSARLLQPGDLAYLKSIGAKLPAK